MCALLDACALPCKDFVWLEFALIMYTVRVTEISYMYLSYVYKTVSLKLFATSGAYNISVPLL